MFFEKKPGTKPSHPIDSINHSDDYRPLHENYDRDRDNHNHHNNNDERNHTR